MRHEERRQREFQRNRDDILLAAARAFARSGFGKATMQDIAGEAGYTAASLYTYFASKQEILDALVELIGEELQRSFAEPMPSGLSLGQRLALLTQRQLEVVERRRELVAVFFTEAALPASSKGRVCRAHPFELRVQLLSQWLTANAAPGELGAATPEDAARMLVGMVYSFMHGWVVGGSEVLLLDRIPIILELFWHGVLGERAAVGRS
jgi:AcrR family transcriptional regulator